MKLPRLAAGGLLTVVLALVLSAGLVLNTSQTASAVAAPPLPSPVNILPSVEAAAARTGADGYSIMLALLGQLQKNRIAAAAVKAGTATVEEAATIAPEIAKFAMPATKAAPLLKGAGAAAVAVTTGWTVGTTMGNSASTLLGWPNDSDSVCSQTAESVGAGVEVMKSLASFINGVDCDAWQNKIDAAKANNDVSAGTAGQQVCLYGNATECVQLLAVGQLFGGPIGCWLLTGASGGTGSTSNPDNDWSIGFLDAAGWHQFLHPIPFLPSRHDDAADLCRSGSPTSNMLDVETTENPPLVQKYGFVKRSDGQQIGDEADVVSLTANPDRFWRCIVTGHTGAEYSADSPTFKETDTRVAPVVCPPVPSPDWGVHQTIYEYGGPTPLEVQDTDTTPEYQASQTDYPDCATGLCSVELYPTATPTTSCHDLGNACADWFTDTNRDTDYQCKYGTHLVNISECYYLSPSFKPEATTTGHPYGDPLTGAPLPGQTGSTADQSTYANGIDDPTTARECFPTGWDVFNPVQWVFRPVQCAFQWAFIPTPDHVADAQAKMKTALDDSPPGKISAFVSALSFPAAPTGCSGFTIDISGFASVNSVAAQIFHGPGLYQVMNACDGQPLHPWAVGTSFLIGAGVIFLGFRGLLKMAGALFGYTGPGSGA